MKNASTKPMQPTYLEGLYAASMRPVLAQAVKDRAAGLVNNDLERAAGEMLAAIGGDALLDLGAKYAADLFAGVTPSAKTEVEKARRTMTNRGMKFEQSAIAPHARKALGSLYLAALGTLKAEMRKSGRRKAPHGLSALDQFRRSVFIESANADQVVFYAVPEFPGSLKAVFEADNAGTQEERYRRGFRLPDLDGIRAARRDYLAAAREIAHHARQIRTLVNGGRDSPGLYSLRFVAKCMAIFAPPHAAERPLVHCFVCHRHVKVSKRSVVGSPTRNSKSTQPAQRQGAMERMYYCAEHGTSGKGDARNFKRYKHAQSAVPHLFRRLEEVMHRLDEEREEIGWMLRARKDEEVGHASRLHKKALAALAAETRGGLTPGEATDAYMHRVRRLRTLRIALERKLPLRYKTPLPAWGHFAFVEALPANWDGVSQWQLEWRDLDRATCGLPKALWSGLDGITDNAAPFAKKVKALAKKGVSWGGFLEAFYREYDDPFAADAVAAAMAEVRQAVQAEVAIADLPPFGWAENDKAEKMNDALREAAAAARLKAGDPDRHVPAPRALRIPHHFLEDFVRLCESSRLEGYKPSPGRPRTIDAAAVWKIAKPLRAQGWGSKKINIRLEELKIKISVEATRKLIREMESGVR